MEQKEESNKQERELVYKLTSILPFAALTFFHFLSSVLHHTVPWFFCMASFPSALPFLFPSLSPSPSNQNRAVKELWTSDYNQKCKSCDNHKHKDDKPIVCKTGNTFHSGPNQLVKMSPLHTQRRTLVHMKKTFCFIYSCILEHGVQLC